MNQIKRNFSLEYWQDDGWYIGTLKKVPGVFSQGESLNELEENIADAYKLMIQNNMQSHHLTSQIKEIAIEIWKKL